MFGTLLSTLDTLALIPHATHAVLLPLEYLKTDPQYLISSPLG